MNPFTTDDNAIIFNDLGSLIDTKIEEKIKSDNDYKKQFKHPLLDELNKKYKNNPYSLDKYMIPVRLKDRKKRSIYGWISDEANNIININVDERLLALHRKDIYEETIKNIMTKYPKNCTPRSTFSHIITIVNDYREKQEVEPVIDEIDLDDIINDEISDNEEADDENDGDDVLNYDDETVSNNYINDINNESDII